MTARDPSHDKRRARGVLLRSGLPPPHGKLPGSGGLLLVSGKPPASGGLHPHLQVSHHCRGRRHTGNSRTGVLQTARPSSCKRLRNWWMRNQCNTKIDVTVPTTQSEPEKTWTGAAAVPVTFVCPLAPVSAALALASSRPGGCAVSKHVRHHVSCGVVVGCLLLLVACWETEHLVQ